MSSESKLSFKVPLIGSILIIGLGATILVLTLILWNISLFPDPEMVVYQLSAIIILGFVLPGIMLGVSWICLYKSENSQSTLFVCSIIITTISGISIPLSIFFIVFAAGLFDVGFAAFYIAIIICIIGAIISQVFCLITGIKNILKHFEK